MKIFIKELHKLHLMLLSHVHYICGLEAQLFIHFWKNIIFSAVFFFTFGHFKGFNAIVTELVFNIQKLESSLVHQKQTYNFHLKLTNNFWSDFCFLTHTHPSSFGIVSETLILIEYVYAEWFDKCFCEYTSASEFLWVILDLILPIFFAHAISEHIAPVYSLVALSLLKSGLPWVYS